MFSYSYRHETRKHTKGIAQAALTFFQFIKLIGGRDRDCKREDNA